MASLEEIFPLFEVSELENTQLEAAWTGLINGLKGGEVPSLAIDHFQALEPAVLDFYCQEICTHSQSFFAQESPEIVDAEILAALVQELQSKFMGPLQRLPFSLESKQAVERLFTALLRIQFGESFITSKTVEFLKVHELNSPQSVEILTQLRQNGGLDVEIDHALSIVLPGTIHDLIRTHFQNNWSQSVLEESIILAQETVLPILTAIGIYDGELRSQISRIAQEKLAELRISELFDIILNVQDSQAALMDLKTVMHTPDLRAKTVATLQKDCTARLLNNGVDTSSIILFYWDLVKILSLLDPRGVVLDKVTPAIHRYLKDRSDTVSIIVNGIIGEQDSPLAKLSEELVTVAPNAIADGGPELDISWQPDPIDAPPDFVKRQTGDIVSTFFMLYDNQEVYIKQLNTVFSEKLLAVNSAAELAELTAKANSLKKRFGERQLQNIYVMIRDVRKSMKLQELSRSVCPVLDSTRPIIVSHRYWLNIKDERGSFPQEFQSFGDEYTKVFEEHYPRRKLFWLPNDSRVSLKLELEDRVLEILATPEQAAIINCFSNVPDNTAGNIAASLNLDIDQVRRALVFWVAQGVLKRPDEDQERYLVLEKVDDMARLDVLDPLLQEPSSSSKRAAEEMMIYWQYIVGMLTNLGSLPVEKIHSFLVMFVPKDDPYVKTKQELESFLHVMVDQEKLVESEGKYSLKKN